MVCYSTIGQYLKEKPNDCCYHISGSSVVQHLYVPCTKVVQSLLYCLDDTA